nr:L1_beta_lactamase [uncultured bacterium]
MTRSTPSLSCAASIGKISATTHKGVLKMKKKHICLTAIVLAASLVTARAADWYAPQEPFAIYGNTYYVGTGGISAVLVTSPAGHILIDVGAPMSPPQIVASIRQLGFKVEDIRYILNSHAHHDHAGGIAELQKLSGATVVASPASAELISSGQPDKTDPQLPDLVAMPPVGKIRVIHDGEVLELGPLALTAHFTPGHTKGGTSWTWQSTENGRVANMVFADSLFAMSGAGVRFSDNPGYPNAKADLDRSITTVESLKCDVLVAGHPELGGLWERKAKQPVRGNAAFIDRDACRNYGRKARARLAETLAGDVTAAAAAQATRLKH